MGFNVFVPYAGYKRFIAFYEAQGIESLPEGAVLLIRWLRYCPDDRRGDERLDPSRKGGREDGE